MPTPELNGSMSTWLVGVRGTRQDKLDNYAQGTKQEAEHKSLHARPAASTSNPATKETKH
jgi:hypothetical protein